MSTRGNVFQTVLCVLIILLASSTTWAGSPSRFAVRLCHERPDLYGCIKADKSTEWKRSFPDNWGIVQKVNRRNTPIRRG
jgi:hypothetical protein